MIAYTNRELVSAIKRTDAPNYGQTADGYGPKLPTQYMVRYGTRWHRVYVAQYGNAGSAYIVHGGEDLVLDHATEIDLQLLP